MAINLKSERGIESIMLRNLLAAGKWEEAHQETAKAICQCAGRIDQRFLDIQDIDAFPCEDLRTINQLWLYYSNNKFSFSVQKQIYENLGGTRDYDEKVWITFCDLFVCSLLSGKYL